MKAWHFELIAAGLFLLFFVPMVLYMPGDDDAYSAPQALEASSAMKTHAENGISFEYPETLSTTYIRPVEWPPKVAVSEGSISCDAVETEIGMTRPVTVEGRTYCVTTRSEGAAGSMYTDYTYSTEKEGKTLMLTFTLKFVQCANYEEPDRSLCTAERETFLPDALADRMLESTIFP